MIATASPNDRTVRVWSASSGSELYRIDGNRPQRVLFAAKSGLLMVTDASATRIYRARDGVLRATLESPVPLTAASFSQDGRLVAGGSADGVAGIWNATTGKLIHPLRGHKARVVAASFGPGDTRVVTASEDSTARLWNARTGGQEHVLIGHEAPLTDAHFDPTGRRVVTASRDNDARTWSVVRGTLIRTLRAHFGAVTAASYSPDGRWIVTAGPTTAGLWRASTGRLLSFLRGPSSTLTSASFSPDGRRILASSQDGTIRVYRCDVCGEQNELEILARLRLDRAHGKR
jgi:WD40 repeat protein